MNEVNGLSSLPSKSIDLCISDIPFNVDLKTSDPKIAPIHRSIDPNKIIYQDNMKDYKNFCKTLLIELERICNGIVLQIGEKNISLWCEIKEPRGFAYHYKPNSRSRGRISHRLMVTPLIFYGKTKRMNHNFFDQFVYNGFLRKISPHPNLIHPCPVNSAFWYDLISRLQPISVIDPFIGSGTTAEVCTKLGIKWFGYEINEIYKQDIDKRLKNCKKEPKQISLSKYNKRNPIKRTYTLMDFIEV